MLTLQGLYKRFPLRSGLFAPLGDWVYAVNGVTLAIRPNQIYGLVGESGSGKTTIARMIAGVYPPERGAIRYCAHNGATCTTPIALRNHIQYIFQDPAHSLNPKLSIFSLLTAGYRYSKRWPGRSTAEREVIEILESVGLRADDRNRRPNDFSGGQRQRIAIARALIAHPELLVCDEIVSALDVSIRAQIINVLLDLKKRYRLSILFISHDLALVGYLCDKIGVLYRGLLVEEAPAAAIMHHPTHPYTRKLYSAVPSRHTPQSTAPAPPPPAPAWDATTHNRYWQGTVHRYRTVAKDHVVLAETEESHE